MTGPSGRRRMLLLSPAFHGYWRSIERAFTELGYAVRTHCYDARPAGWPGLVEGVQTKLGVELRERLGGPRPYRRADDNRDDRVLQAIETGRADRVLVVKGDHLGDRVWQALTEAGVPTVVWLYDELRRTGYAAGDPRLAAVTAVASYSALDVAALGQAGITSAHVPLAHDPHVPWSPRPSGRIVFVGARYPDRERLLGHLVAAGLPVAAYGRDWSGHPVDRLRTWRLRRPAVPGHRDVSRAAAYGIMAGAAAALNTHSDQDGFTMRTFEAAGVGALQLLDRADVAGLYEPGRECAVFGSADELVELAQRALADPGWGRRLGAAAQARTLAEHTFTHRARALERLWA